MGFDWLANSDIPLGYSFEGDNEDDQGRVTPGFVRTVKEEKTMKWGIALVVIGTALLFDGGIRLALVGWPGFSGIVLAIPCFYYGIRRIRRQSQGDKEAPYNGDWKGLESKAKKRKDGS